MAGKKILIVEDDADISMIEEAYLESAGYETKIVTDGNAVAGVLEQEKFDLMLLDLMLPGKSGYDICKEVRDQIDIPILMVTARTESIDKIRGLGPCLNATGRLETARIALKLLLCESEAEAAVLAQEAVDLNNSRKLLTEQAVEVAKQMIADGGYENDRVFVIFLPDCHESLAGIVAGRIREAYHRPTLVITRGEEGAKGSGRSIDGYSMFEELNKCADLLSSFGGHPMAAGFSLPEENIEAFRRRLNEVCTLTEEELQAKVVIDVPMPIGYITFPLIEQLKLLEPFGKGNDKPVFADRNLVIERLKIYGSTGRVVQLTLHSPSGAKVQAVYFGDPDNLRLPLEEKYGKVVADDTMANRCVHNAALHFTYYPEIDTYYETPRVKLKITGISA